MTGADPKSEPLPRPAGHDTLLLPWKECQREPHWPIFDPDSDFEPDRKADPEAHRLWRFKHYLNEMTAAETLGSILWMTPEMPWEYQYNVSRHLWDELSQPAWADPRAAAWPENEEVTWSCRFTTS